MKHIIKTSLRRIYREKVYSTVNIAGLAMGMASALLVFLFIRYQTSFDKYHPRHKDILRVGTELELFGQSQGYAVSSAALVPAIQKHFPGVKSALRIFYPAYFLQDMIFYSEHYAISDSGIFAVDSTFFDFFHAETIEGNTDEALQKPLSFVVTRTLAKRFFGRVNVVGEKIWLSDAAEFTITAVIEDPPLNTHFRFSGLLSMSSMNYIQELFEYSFGPGMTWKLFEQTFGSIVVWSYILVDNDFDRNNFSGESWTEFLRKENFGLYSEPTYTFHPIFQALASIHLESDLIYELSGESINMRIMNPMIVLVFIVIAVFLLVVASINYTNLSISHFSKRRKEMAMVKVLGSSTRSIFVGFFTEAAIYSFISLGLALVLVEIALEPFNSFLMADMSLNILNDPFLLVVIALVFLVCALLSGLFPAIFFVTTPVIKLLVRRFSTGSRTVFLKNALVTVQFTVAAFMIAATFVVYQQLGFMQNFDLGYDTENITVIDVGTRKANERLDEFEELLRQSKGVQQVARTNYVFSMNPIKHTVLFAKENDLLVRSYYNVQVSEDYLKLMGVGIFAQNGIEAPAGLLSNNGVFVNRVLNDSLNYGWPVGKTIITQYQFLEGLQRREREIKGVVDNFYYALLNRPIEPLIILPLPFGRAKYIAVKFDEVDKKLREEIIRDAWEKFEVRNPLNYYHVEDQIAMFFAENRNLSRFFGYFAWLCIIISFLGIFGITAFDIERRSIEIGIRKVMGASWFDFFLMFFRNYFLQYLMGCSMGFILCYQLISEWLKTFAFSVNPGIMPFIYSGILVGATIAAAIVLHTVRVLYINAAEVLRKD